MQRPRQHCPKQQQGQGRSRRPSVATLRRPWGYILRHVLGGKSSDYLRRPPSSGWRERRSLPTTRVPAGPKSHVHVATAKGPTTSWVQSMRSLVEATKGGQETWQGFPFLAPATPMAGIKAEWYMRPATAAK